MNLSRGFVLLVLWAISVAGSRPCPENCKKNPPFPTCKTGTSTCSRGCVPGYYGTMCNLTCDANCKQGTCRQRDGLCICKPGYTFNSKSCDSRKGVKCQSNDHCLNDTCISADRQDCLVGCKPGWFGKFCQYPCSSNCVCHIDSGNCTLCVPGWYGAECGTRCSDGCVDKKCDRDGICSIGCAKGFKGQKCEYTCPKQCHDEQCDSNGTCNVSGCQRGFYGESCTKSCGKCSDEFCNQTTGACTKGCQSGHYGTSCRETCENCDGGECDQDTGECSDKWSSVQSWVGGGVAVLILIIIIAVGIYMSRRLKRIQGVVYNIEKRRGGPASAEQDVRPVAAQGYFELEEQVTLTHRRVCPIAPIRQTSYIEPRHSGNFGNLQIQPQLQAAGVSDQQNDDPQGSGIPHSDRLLQKVQRRSDEWSERPDSYVFPHYCEVNEEGMATPPQLTQGIQAPTYVVKTNVFSVAADVHATRGNNRIPPVAELFGPTATEDSSPELQPLVENYDHLNREGIPGIDGAEASSSNQEDDDFRIRLERLSQMSTTGPDSYIEPRHSDCKVSSQQQMLSAVQSDQHEDEPQALDDPPPDRLLDDALIAEVPQPAQRAETTAHGEDNSAFPVDADVHTKKGDISIPLIAESFGPTETEDLSSDDDSELLVENYDPLFRDHYMEH